MAGGGRGGSDGISLDALGYAAVRGAVRHVGGHLSDLGACVGILTNRHARRRAVKQGGGNWRRERAAKRAADASDWVALLMPPLDARRILAEWAGRPGRTQADVDALNRMGTDAD